MFDVLKFANFLHTGWYSTAHNFLYIKCKISITFPVLHTCYMLTFPCTKTPPIPLHFLCSIHATCRHFLFRKLHTYHYISCAPYMPHDDIFCCQKSTNTTTFPVLHTCHMLTFPCTKTPSIPLHFLCSICSIHATC